MVDKQKTYNLIDVIEKYFTILSEYTNLTQEDYLKDKKTIYSSRYLIQVCVESCINLSNHIIASQKLGIPCEYADSFRILQKNNIIGLELTNKLVNMTRFRNRIVHIYWDIDDEFVYQIIQNDLRDILDFIEEIKIYLKSGKL